MRSSDGFGAMRPLTGDQGQTTFSIGFLNQETEMFANLFIALVLLTIVLLLYFAPRLRVLNFVDYASPETVVQINRYAAARLLVPVLVGLVCAGIAQVRPDLTVPLLFPVMISIVVAVVWIASGVNRIKA